MKTVKELETSAYKEMKGTRHYKNAMAAPHLTKVVISVGTGSAMKRDPKRNDFIADRLGKITGQKTALRGAKKSIATFKVRQGDPIGLMVTLRGTRMYGFLDKLFDIVIPRTKDFRGLDIKGVDSIGNLTIGIREHTIFPETADEELRDVFGFAVTLVTTAKTRNEALEFFRLIGVPFKKSE